MPNNQTDDPTTIRNDVTVDLTLDESESVDDLQAFADEAAEEMPEQSSPAGNAENGIAQDDQISSYLNQELERTLEEATARIKELEKHETEHLDKHHRLLADFANYRNRTARDIQMAVDQAESKMLRELLPVLDSFERCLGASYRSLEDFQNGVELIHKQFLDALRRVGVEGVKIEVGDPFDALHSEALTTTSNPSLPDGVVAAIYERGFTLRNQLLRAARVVVNRSDFPETVPESKPNLDRPGESV